MADPATPSTIPNNPMSYSASSQPRRRRGGRNRNPQDNNGDRRNNRKSFDRDTETFKRPTTPPKPTFWERLLGIFGFGPKTPSRPARRPSPTPASAGPIRSQSGGPSAREAGSRSREDRPARAPRPVVQHEVTSGRLYVGNLSYDVTESDLLELFGGIGQVRSAEVVCHRQNQRSKGFAFVEMLTIDEARRAVAELHDKEYMGRKMLVTGARTDTAPTDGDATDERQDSRPRDRADDPSAPAPSTV